MRLAVKEALYGVVASLFYRWRTSIGSARAPKVMSIEQTVDHVLTTGCSLVRFGDGELAILRGQRISYQDPAPQLSEALRDALVIDRPNVLICVPGVFDGMPEIDAAPRHWWIKQLLRGNAQWLALTGTDRLFGNAFLSRPYLMYQNFDAARIARLFESIKALWADRHVTIVEGNETRFGVGNDLLDNATSVTRILCPSRNAFEALDLIEARCLTVTPDNLFLIALGPAAKPLVVRLWRAGRRALDIGHLDIEYEWFVRGATGPILVPGKAMDGTVGPRQDDATQHDRLYFDQIIGTIEAQPS